MKPQLTIYYKVYRIEYKKDDMNKDIKISIESALKEEEILFPKIFCCKNYSYEEKRTGLSDSDLINMLLDMYLIRSFENKIKTIKKTKKWAMNNLSIAGPIHLINGEEAACVGQAYALDMSDYSFGSHRSHGELLARAMYAISRCSEEELMKIMKEYQHGYIYEKARDIFRNNGDIKELARFYVLYGAVSEILGKDTGFQKGCAGSMHMFFPPFGVFPANAIVGASAPIATGAALYKKIKGEKSISIANLGDGAVGCGIVFESMNFAAMKQFNLLWEKKGGLPVLFNFFNNGYGMGGSTVGETMAYDKLVRISSGISENALNAERVNGMDPLAVYYATKRKKNEIIKGNGPALLDIVTYRYEGHSESDKEEARESKEISQWKEIDPIDTFASKLIEERVISKEQILSSYTEIEELLKLAFDSATDMNLSPRTSFSREKRIDSFTQENIIDKLIESNNLHLNEFEKKDLTNWSLYGAKEALNIAVKEAFERYDNLVSFGVNARDWGGSNLVYSGIKKDYGYERLFNSPVSEACMVSVAIGYSMSGGRAIVDLMFSGFIGRAGDEIFNQLAKWNSISAGYFNLKVIIRVTTSRTYGAQHSQDWVSLVTHIPGLCVLYPVTPFDIKGLFNAALESSKPVVFFENKELLSEEKYKMKIPNTYYTKQIGEPTMVSEGNNITILTIGSVLYDVLAALKDPILSGITADVFSAGSIEPFEYRQIQYSIKKTGKCFIVGHENERVSVLKNFAFDIYTLSEKDLKKPPIILGAYDGITPIYENMGDFIPNIKLIIKKILELCSQ
jgi:2-oxoisovalerate dehydrogenase E1 component